MIETGVSESHDVPVRTSSLSFGSRDEAVRERAREIMSKAIRLARDLGIRTIQLAGYDVYYEDHDEGTRQRFAEGLAWAVEQAAASQVMLAVEIMELRVYELHQQMEKMGRDARLAVVHRLPGRRQPQRPGR
ncbi:TIM barrel protein [Escherichia coli]